MTTHYDIKHPAPFFDSSLARPKKALKTISERRPYSTLPSFKSKSLAYRFHSTPLPPLDEDAPVNIISPPKLRLDLPKRPHLHHVHFMPLDQEKLSKGPSLPRTPYPTTGEEDDLILAQFSRT
ncbi:hypothetical protein BGX31_003437 [Mortierella sp. GBA43]|nr:hypothetical protein BGX31_003428 [Mortierella sp. GBA43]KAG0246961.1 hypothetical protein BGX31_003437 [Mortierella sp. GBA43]